MNKESDEVHYREVLEAIGMLGKRSTVNNKLNKVFSHASDEKLRSMVGDMMSKLPFTSINSQVITLRDSRALETKGIENYCREKLGRDLYQEPKSQF